jgi:hypothetical protein
MFFQLDYAHLLKYRKKIKKTAGMAAVFYSLSNALPNAYEVS